jgi:hypothetical protein
VPSLKHLSLAPFIFVSAGPDGWSKLKSTLISFYFPLE